MELELPDEDESEIVEIETSVSGDGRRRLRHSHVDYKYQADIETEAGAIANGGRQLQSTTTQVVDLLYPMCFAPTSSQFPGNALLYFEADGRFQYKKEFTFCHR